MPIPVTKIYLSSSNSGAAGYQFTAPAPTDFSVLVTGASIVPWIAALTDVNGDGISEVITGVAYDDDKAVDAGRVFVNFGVATGGVATGVDAPVDKYIIDGVNAGDHAGSSVGSVTDLNGDGKAEVLVGASGMDKGALLDAGAAFVLWGKATTTGIDLADPFSGGGMGYVLKGEAAGDAAGSAMTSIADLNGDGKAEIIVAAVGNDAKNTDAGAVYVSWGKSTSSIVNLTNVAAGTGGFRILGEGKNDHAGSALSVLSDVNGDGKGEIIIGADGSEAGGKDSGAAYVVFGKSTTTQVDLSNVAAGVGGYRITGDLGDRIGGAVAGVGDVNGDGVSDVLVGAAGNNHAYLVFGKSTTSEVLLSDVAAGIGGFEIVAEAGGNLNGISVAKGGDFNHDGINDILIGPPYDSEGGFNAGAVYIVWGGASGAIDLSNVAAGIGGAKIVGTAGSLTGYSVASLTDMTGDGRAEVLIGSPGAASESLSVVYAPSIWQPEVNIYGTSGNDVMGAGYGVAPRIIGAGNDAILGLAGNDVISGAGGNDSMEGGIGNDTLNGNEGDDTLDGGTGIDSLVGGIGNDTYIIDNAADVTSELAGEGTDTVVASVNWTLSSDIEVLQLAGSARVGTGNGLDNTITGTSFADTLDGAAGVDTLNGGAGNDTYKVDGLGDVVNDSAGTDTIIATIDYSLATLGAIENLQLAGTAHVGTGNALNNSLVGTSGDDTLDGAAGVDTLNGGAGNDTYYVDVASDSVVESVGGGNDTVIASANYTLGLNVESLQLTGAARIGTGNGLDNTITGTAFADTLDGGVGNDTLAGGVGNDTYKVDSLSDVVQELAGEGTDTVIASVDYTLGDNVEALQLAGLAHVGTGNAGDNSITGTALADTLDGAAGVDTLIGGAGNDVYHVDAAADVVQELAGEGTDTVIASADYTLGDNVESLVLTGAAHVGTGNAGDNTLTGGIGDDTLNGAGGNDTLDGGTGTNLLIGGAGDDVYIVHSASDVIQEDVGGGNDTVWVDADWSIADNNVESVQLIGGAHAVTGSAGNNHISGGAGNDTIDGGAGDDL
jgi:Ca2+-binding RTX toxin-like protein